MTFGNARRRVLVQIAYVLVCISVLATGITPVFMSYPPRLPDCDITLIEGGVAKARTFADIMGWWHGTWVGQVPFWRPLTSMVFYAEAHTFGLGNWRAMMAASFVLHLLFVGAFLQLIRTLTRNHWLALLSVLWFAGWRGAMSQLRAPLFSVSTPASVALQSWKDQPDLLAGVCVVTTCLLAINKRWGWALVAATAAVCFKESGWLAFPLAVICVCAAEGGLGWLKQVPRATRIAAALCVLALVCLRWSAGPEVWRGYHVGANQGWLVRYSASALGHVARTLNPVEWPYAVLAIVVAGVLLSRGRLGLRVVTLVTGVLACGLVVGAGEGGLVIGLIKVLDPACKLYLTVRCTLWLLLCCAAVTGRFRRHAPPLALAVMLLTLPYVAATQAAEHTLYVAFAFQAVLVVASVWSAAEHLARMLSLVPGPSPRG